MEDWIHFSLHIIYRSKLMSRQDVKMWVQHSAHGTKIREDTISWESITKFEEEWLTDTIWYYLESTILSSRILGTMLPHLYGYTISGDHCNPWHIYFVATYMQPKPLELPEMQGHFLILNFSNVTQNLGFGLWKECNEPKYTKFSKWNIRPEARFSFPFTLWTPNTLLFCPCDDSLCDINKSTPWSQNILVVAVWEGFYGLDCTVSVFSCKLLCPFNPTALPVIVKGLRFKEESSPLSLWSCPAVFSNAVYRKHALSSVQGRDAKPSD